MDNLHNRLNSALGKMNKIYHFTAKSLSKIFPSYQINTFLHRFVILSGNQSMKYLVLSWQRLTILTTLDNK